MPEENKDPNKSFFDGLLEFLNQHAVIGLAIGVIIAQTTKDLVDAIVQGLFTPLIDLIVPGERLRNLVFVIRDSRFDIGLIISAATTFIIVMVLLYIIVKQVLKREELLKKK